MRYLSAEFSASDAGLLFFSGRGLATSVEPLCAPDLAPLRERPPELDEDDGPSPPRINSSKGDHGLRGRGGAHRPDSDRGTAASDARHAGCAVREGRVS